MQMCTEKIRQREFKDSLILIDIEQELSTLCILQGFESVVYLSNWRNLL